MQRKREDKDTVHAAGPEGAEESKMEIDEDAQGEAAGSGAATAVTAAGRNPGTSGEGGGSTGSGAGAGAGARAGATARALAERDAAAAALVEKYEWVKIPAPVVRHSRLRLLCSVLRLEACSDNSFQVSSGTRRDRVKDPA